VATTISKLSVKTSFIIRLLPTRTLQIIRGIWIDDQNNKRDQTGAWSSRESYAIFSIFKNLPVSICRGFALIRRS
jgi:hypothetical protein